LASIGRPFGGSLMGPNLYCSQLLHRSPEVFYSGAELHHQGSQVQPRKTL
jgi:hypothetical protein